MSDPISDTRAPDGPGRALQLGALVSAAAELAGVRRGDLAPGDQVLVSTKNSVYLLVARLDGRFVVSGGWFARHGERDRTLPINGCTAGGHAIFTDIVAAPRLFLEFGDGTRTTRIRCVRKIPAAPREIEADQPPNLKPVEQDPRRVEARGVTAPGGTGPDTRYLRGCSW